MLIFNVVSYSLLLFCRGCEVSGGMYLFTIKTTGGMWPAASTLWTQMLHFTANRKLDSHQEMTRRWARGLRTTLQTIGQAVMDRGCLRGDTAGALRERVEVDVASVQVKTNTSGILDEDCPRGGGGDGKSNRWEMSVEKDRDVVPKQKWGR